MIFLLDDSTGCEGRMSMGKLHLRRLLPGHMCDVLVLGSILSRCVDHFRFDRASQDLIMVVSCELITIEDVEQPPKDVDFSSDLKVIRRIEGRRALGGFVEQACCSIRGLVWVGENPSFLIVDRLRNVRPLNDLPLHHAAIVLSLLSNLHSAILEVVQDGTLMNEVVVSNLRIKRSASDDRGINRIDIYAEVAQHLFVEQRVSGRERVFRLNHILACHPL
mmetsp:Transcript_33808/g.75976  ORF Transcript_33808/g.75976 Transcript_33808/m.75976 type:complete len:220 (+) Transcript_33808:1114-1773(+)